jgi:hypothetical protein
MESLKKKFETMRPEDTENDRYQFQYLRVSTFLGKEVRAIDRETNRVIEGELSGM